MNSISAEHSTPPKMLIADDDPAVLGLLSARCRNLGFEVETATNGIQALIKAKRSWPDILVVDVNMPEIDGLSLCLSLLDPTKEPLHVIVITGSRSPEVTERCEGFGAFFAPKGPLFWEAFSSALAETFPQMSASFDETAKFTAGRMRIRPLVLVIDNDLNTKKLLSTRLEKCGVDTMYASDVTQGYRLACRENPSVVVTENYMPNGDAQYLLSRLRTNPSTEKVPVVILSSHELDDLTVQALKREICGHSGVVGVFQKSSDTHDLFATLQKYCGFENNRLAI